MTSNNSVSRGATLMRGMFNATLALLTAAAFIASATAAAPDAAFGAGRGYVPVSAPNPLSDTVTAIVGRPDNKFVILGRRLVAGRGVLLLQRYAPDSTIDTTFGDQGTLTIDLGESLTPRQLAVQPSGRLLVASESPSAFRVRAYLPSGQVDASFGLGGELLFPRTAGAPAGTSALQVLNSGAMLVIVQNSPAASLALSVYRYNIDGLFDPDFGPLGRHTVANLGAGLSFTGIASALADDRVVIATAGSDGVTRTLILLARDGFPDPAFGTGGSATPAALQGKAIRKIAPLVSNYFVVAAVAGSGNAQSSTITRFDPAGNIDPQFAVVGTLAIAAAGVSGIAIDDVFEQIDNYLVVTASTPQGMLVARYVGRGVLDQSFNGGRGVLIVPEPAARATQAVATLSFGGAQLISIGYGLAFGSVNGPTAASRAFMVSANEGALDIEYGGKGIVSLFGRKLESGEYAQQVLPLPDGKILVLSATGADRGLIGTLSRFLADGSIDPAFGTQGRSDFFLNGKCEWPISMALQPDGKVVVLGTNFNTIDCDSSAMFGKRFDVNGVLDSFSFIYSGTVAHARSGGLAIQADGKTVVTGQDNTSLVVARFLTGGGPDLAFASSGRSLWLRSAGDNAKGGAVLIQPDQKIVVAGSMNGTHLVLLRFGGTGAADPSFGSAGVALTVIPGSGFLEVQALTMTPQGRLLVLARLGNIPLLAQFDASGAPDFAFGTAGLVTLPLSIGGAQSSHFGLTVQPDGGIVVSGQSTSNSSSQFALMRLSVAGQVDSAFGTNGTFLWRPSEFFPAGATGVASLNGANLLAVGYGLPGAFLTRVRVADVSAAVLEFYNTLLNHYFITADPAEQAAIDAGAAGPGWSRTGFGFRAYTLALGIPLGQSPVCRFYGSTVINPVTGMRRGPNSHFYTAEPAECAAVQTDPGWMLEGFAFNTRRPGAGGVCAAGTVPVYRNYNNRALANDSNHRYTTDIGIYQLMQGMGWTPEGVVFCAAP